MSEVLSQLEAMSREQRKFLRKGGLCVGLILTRTAAERGLPLDPTSLRTVEGGQVAGLGKSAVQKILESHGITNVLAEEGGRTSRGSLGLMETYVAVLNRLNSQGQIDFDEVLEWWIDKVRAHLASEGPKFVFDATNSLRSNLEDLFQQAFEIQRNAQGSNYVGSMLQHLVGAKLDLVLGPGAIKHHGASVADHSTERAADFEIRGAAIHVTTHPSEALLRKISGNLKAGLKPLIITLGDGVEGALFLLKATTWAERVDVLDAAQFLTANVYERSLFDVAGCQSTLRNILQRYNEIVAENETDPVLIIRLD